MCDQNMLFLRSKIELSDYHIDVLVNGPTCKTRMKPWVKGCAVYTLLYHRAEHLTLRYHWLLV